MLRLIATTIAALVAATATISTASVQATDEVPDYSRSSFGGWVTVSDGCDTRDAILVEESLVPFECDDEVGQWLSIWDGDTITNPSTMDIDHHVPLKEAWVSGAWAWTEDQRIAFSNDPLNLNAVSSGVNRQKGDRDPASWLPRYEQCAYVEQWVEVKTTYDLSIDPDEQQAIDVVTDLCLPTPDQPDEPMPWADYDDE